MAYANAGSKMIFVVPNQTCAACHPVVWPSEAVGNARFTYFHVENMYIKIYNYNVIITSDISLSPICFIKWRITNEYN